MCVPSVAGPWRRLVGDDGDLALVEQAVELAGAALVAPVVELPQVPREEAQAHAVRDLPQHARRPPPPRSLRPCRRVRRHLVRRRRHGCWCSSPLLLVASRRSRPARARARTGGVRLQAVPVRQDEDNVRVPISSCSDAVGGRRQDYPVRG